MKVHLLRNNLWSWCGLRSDYGMKPFIEDLIIKTEEEKQCKTCLKSYEAWRKKK